MLEMVQYIGVGAALLSCMFWTASASVRVKSFWHRTLHVEDSLAAIVERQSRMNAFAALFAAIAAASQAFALFLRT